MSRQIEITVPVKSFVKKFIEAKYYNQRDGFLLPRRDEPLGLLLGSFLRKNFLTTVEDKPRGSVIQVRLYCDSKLMHIPKSALPQIANLLEANFREAILMYAIAYYNEYNLYQPGVEKFLDMYGINEDEMSVNSAMRIVRLWEEKTSRNQRKFRGESAVNAANVQ